jgi:hypothetical protein
MEIIPYSFAGVHSPFHMPWFRLFGRLLEDEDIVILKEEI